MIGLIYHGKMRMFVSLSQLEKFCQISKKLQWWALINKIDILFSDFPEWLIYNLTIADRPEHSFNDPVSTRLDLQ